MLISALVTLQMAIDGDHILVIGGCGGPNMVGYHFCSISSLGTDKEDKCILHFQAFSSIFSNLTMSGCCITVMACMDGRK